MPNWPKVTSQFNPKPLSVHPCNEGKPKFRMYMNIRNTITIDDAAQMKKIFEIIASIC